MGDVGNNDGGLGAFKEVQGLVTYSELVNRPSVVEKNERYAAEAKLERFNCLLTYAEDCIVKGTSDPAKFVLAAMCLDYLQYKECDALMKNAIYKQRFDSTADKLEKYSMEFGVIGITVERGKYKKK